MTLWPNGTKNIPDLSTGYGYYPGTTDKHYGQDFINFDYNCATDDGRVVYAGWNPSGAGYEIRVDHGDYISRYLHNQSNLLAGFGQDVEAGQPIGVQGSTGDSSGKHLHYEVWPGGNINNRTDPVPYIASRVASTAGGGSTPFPKEIKVNEMLGMAVYTVINPNGGMSGAYFVVGPNHIVNVDASTGIYLASILNVDSMANSSQGKGKAIDISQDNIGNLAVAIGAPYDIFPQLYVGTVKVWRVASSITGNVAVDNTKVIEAINAIDAKVSNVPTAEQNGVAARAAIVK